MAHVRQVRGTNAVRMLPAVLLGLICGLSSGCVTLGGMIKQDAGKPCETPFQVTVTWKNEVVFSPDPTHGGKLTPGLLGRVVLSAPSRALLEGDGSLHVELADGAATPPKVMEQWDIDSATMKKLQKKDFVGPGYSILLPWSTYRPELTKVQLRLAYQPGKGGAALYSSPSMLALNRDPDPAAPKKSSGPTSPTPTLPMPR